MCQIGEHSSEIAYLIGLLYYAVHVFTFVVSVQ